MGAERQNQVQAQPEEIGEGVTVQLNIDKKFKTDPHIEMEITPRHRTSSTGGYQLATFVGGPRASGKHLP